MAQEFFIRAAVATVSNQSSEASQPVVKPTFWLVINVKTDKALGPMIPQPVLLRADEVVQTLG